MKLNVLHAMILAIAIIAFVVERISYARFVKRSEYEVKKSEFYCNIVTFKAKYNLLPNKDRLEGYPNIRCLIEDIAELERILSVHVDFDNIKFSNGGRVTLDSLKRTLELIDDLDKVDEDIKDLFEEARIINEKMAKLYSKMFYFWTYYSTKIQVKFIYYYISFIIFVIRHIPVLAEKEKKDIEREYSFKNEDIVDSVLCIKRC